MKLFSNLDYSQRGFVHFVCITTVLISITGCDSNTTKTVEETKIVNEPAKIEPDPTATAQFLKSNLEDVAIQLPTCVEKHCPQIQIQRLKSNYAELDQVIDQYIANYVKQAVQSFDIQEPNDELTTTETQSNTPMTGIVEKHHQISDTQAQQNVKEQEKIVSANQKLAQQLQANIDKFVHLSDEVKSLGSSAQQTLYIRPQVLNSKSPIATIVINSNNYMGGAHGSTAQYYLNFSFEDRRVLNLDQIIQQGQRKKFNDLVYQKYQAWVNEIQLNTDMQAYETLWPFQISENFYLSPKSLILQYGEYEIGPYAVGLPRLEIPYEELDTILIEKYLPTAMKDAKAVKSAATENTAKAKP